MRRRDQAGCSDHESLHQRFHRRTHVARITADFRVKEGFGDDLQREPHHVVLGVADLSVSPRAEHALGKINHEPPIGGDPFAVKRGLYQLALTAPELTLADQETLAQSPSCVPQAVMLDELPILVNQNLFNQVGMIDEDNVPRANRAQTTSPYS